jgi:hypothetical protein
LRRGPYVIAACLEESLSETPLELKGLFVDIYDAKLRVHDKVTLKPGQRAWLLDLNRLEKGKAQPIASAGRFETWTPLEQGVEFELSAPEGITIVSRLRLPKRPRSLRVGGQVLTDYTWHEKSQTVFFQSPKYVQKQTVRILW